MSLQLILQVFILQTLVFGLFIFLFKKILFDNAQGAVNRLNRETEAVRTKQSELNEKIKQANEELEKRKKEADTLVLKMKEEAEGKAREEREKLVNKARQESEEILAKAQRTKDEMRKVIQKEVEMKMVDFAAEILGTVIGEKGKKVLDDFLVIEFIEELKKIDMDMIGSDVVSAEIITALPLQDKSRQRLSQIIKEKLNRDIKIEAKVDPKVISGAVLRFGSLVLDGSLNNAMKEVGMTLKEKIEKS